MEQATIIDVPTTAYKPRTNAVRKHMHQTVDNVLQTFVHENPPRNTGDAKDLVDESLSIAQHAMRCSVHTTLSNSPCLFVFNRDIFLSIPLTEILMRALYSNIFS